MGLPNPVTRRERYLSAMAGGDNPVPAKPETREEQYLAAILESGGDGGTGEVTGVKGNAESTYRRGNVNLTPANIGAASATDLDGKVDKHKTGGVDDRLMTAAEGTKLSGIEDEANKTTVDSSITQSGTNPVEGGAIYTALAGKVNTSSVGAANGVASLDNTGKVPSSQLPSYVDDTVEGYLHDGHFYADDQYTTEITGEGGKIYVDLATNKTYRWSGSAFVEISASLALGETAGTAYEGSKGKANADAIAAIKDGTNIDSFADVETALDLKANKSEMTITDGTGADAGTATIQLKTGTSKKVITDISGKADLTDLAPAFDSTSSYAIGNYVTYNGNLYRCTTTHSGAWNAAHFAQATAGGELEKRANRVAGATEGNLAMLTGNGDIADSGRKIGDYATNELLKDTVGWTGKNLLKIPEDVATVTNNGVTFTVNRNADGEVVSIVANGTASANATIIIRGNSNLSSFNGFIMSGCPTGGGDNLYFMQIEQSESPYTRYARDIGNGATISDVPNSDTSQMLIRIAKNYTADNLTFYPMIRRANETDDTYEPYHTDVKQTLRDVEVIEGKNLLDSAAVSQSIDGVTFTVNSDGTVKAAGTPTGIIRYYFTGDGASQLTEIPSWLIGKEVIISCGVTENNGTMELSCITYSDPSTIITDHMPGNGETEKKFTIESNAKYLRIYAVIDRDGEHAAVNTTFKPMLRLATEESDTYEQYYIPVKDAMLRREEQRVLGAKNLLPNIATTQTINGVTFTVNSDGTVTANGTATARAIYWYTSNDVDKRMVFDEDVNVSGAPAGAGASTWSMGGNEVGILYEGDKRIEAGKAISVALLVENGVTVNNLTFKPMIRLASDPDDTYVPYAQTNAELTRKITATTVDPGEGSALATNNLLVVYE